MTEVDAAETLIDPVTQRSERHERLIQALLDWARRPAIVAALLRERLSLRFRGSDGTALHFVLDEAGVLQLVNWLGLTVRGGGPELSEAQAGQFVLAFLSTPKLRRTVAGYVAEAEGLKHATALRELGGLRRELEGALGVR